MRGKSDHAQEQTEVKEERKVSKRKALIQDLCLYAVIFVLCFFVIPRYVAQGVTVDGSSMETTLSDSDRLVIDKIPGHTDHLKRFDIVIFDPHNDVDKYWIKRVIGLPGETVQIIGEDIFINGEKLEEHYGKDPIDFAGEFENAYTLGSDEYCVLGDNREVSMDSRMVGPIKAKDIKGKACFRIWPLNEIGTVGQ